MKKILLALSSVAIVGTTSVSVIACTDNISLQNIVAKQKVFKQSVTQWNHILNNNITKVKPGEYRLNQVQINERNNIDISQFFDIGYIGINRVVTSVKEKPDFNKKLLLANFDYKPSIKTDSFTSIPFKLYVVSARAGNNNKLYWDFYLTKKVLPGDFSITVAPVPTDLDYLTFDPVVTFVNDMSNVSVSDVETFKSSVTQNVSSLVEETWATKNFIINKDYKIDMPEVKPGDYSNAEPFTIKVIGLNKNLTGQSSFKAQFLFKHTYTISGTNLNYYNSMIFQVSNPDIITEEDKTQIKDYVRNQVQAYISQPYPELRIDKDYTLDFNWGSRQCDVDVTLTNPFADGGDNSMTIHVHLYSDTHGSKDVRSLVGSSSSLFLNFNTLPKVLDKDLTDKIHMYVQNFASSAIYQLGLYNAIVTPNVNSGQRAPKGDYDLTVSDENTGKQLDELIGSDISKLNLHFWMIGNYPNIDPQAGDVDPRLTGSADGSITLNAVITKKVQSY